MYGNANSVLIDHSTNCVLYYMHLRNYVVIHATMSQWLSTTNIISTIHYYAQREVRSGILLTVVYHRTRLRNDFVSMEMFTLTVAVKMEPGKSYRVFKNFHVYGFFGQKS